ncbi:class I mannose-6-phosphate isomerase [Pedobacter sp. SYP-B3415]|uniref:class I mannose-6-phosphate isomerase n=1 Tax=Pedobacter sp. SYP-B3415 TaxID=2496641 RepID=UPI00101D7237|nr:class I mannose-6-phosphate isomerase [Pedobacter sp. SYP-B3415]
MQHTETNEQTAAPALRRSLQPLMPTRLTESRPDGYNIYPAHSLESGKIASGYAGLASWIAGHKFVAIDGFQGVFFAAIRSALDEELRSAGITANWIDAADFIKPEDQVTQLVSPFTGEPGTVWGTRSTLKLADFFDLPNENISLEGNQLTILIGTGAALLAPSAALVYIDLPKNELQLRMRAGAANNLGSTRQAENAETYKRFYFVDWVVLNAHKKEILPRIAVMADGQWPDNLTWMTGEDLREALAAAATSVFRVRPWFEPGAWGGQWMKERIAGLNPEEVNYAWSFELIVPENGLVFESDGTLLEVSFDCLMFAQRDAVMGDFAERFGDEFPVRFDFLDTWNGGNLSIQCHPTLPYIQQHFGEKITQDETYYILDCQPDADVYLGFQDGIDPVEFRNELEKSQQTGSEVDIHQYVQRFKASKHDLYLIPNGTVHSAGKGNLVLEISATPYIFTFKMYDWLRLDLNGKPRAINIGHAFNNLDFSRQGEKVVNELISKQQTIANGADWQIVHVPTHEAHFYDVKRLEFDTQLEQQTSGSPHICMLVEGESVQVVLKDGRQVQYHYAETFVIPAAAGTYSVINNGRTRAKIVQAYLKPNQH